MAGVIVLALECLEPRQFWNLRRGQASRRHDAELGARSLAVFRRNRPSVRRFVEDGRCYSRAERDVPPQIESICDMVDVGENFRLAGVPLAPAPFLLKLVRERVGVIHALDVAARAGIAVPVPGSTNIVSRLINPDR